VKRTSNGQVDFLATLGNVADRYKQMPAGVDRTALALNVFGRSGKDLIPILNKGSAGLRDLYQEAERMGLVFSQKDLDATRELAIEQRKLNEAITGIEVAIGKAALPAVIVMTRGLVSLASFAHDAELAVGSLADKLAHCSPGI